MVPDAAPPGATVGPVAGSGASAVVLAEEVTAAGGRPGDRGALAWSAPRGSRELTACTIAVVLQLPAEMAAR